MSFCTTHGALQSKLPQLHRDLKALLPGLLEAYGLDCSATGVEGQPGFGCCESCGVRESKTSLHGWGCWRLESSVERQV